MWSCHTGAARLHHSRVATKRRENRKLRSRKELSCVAWFERGRPYNSHSVVFMSVHRHAAFLFEGLGAITYRLRCVKASRTVVSTGWLSLFILPMSIAPCIAAMQKSAILSSLASFESRPLAFSFTKNA